MGVDRLHIKHAGGEQYFEMNEVQDNRITINILEEADLVEGRLHYRQTDSWSPWGSSDSPIMEKQTLQEKLLAAHYHRLRGGPGPHRHRHLPGDQEQEGQDQV